MRRSFSLLSISLLIVVALILSGLTDLVRWFQQQEWAARRGIGYGVEALVADPVADVAPYGVNVYFENHSEEEVTQSLALIQAAGLRWVRLQLPWSAIEARPNVLDWSPWDRWIDLSRRHGLQVILVVTSAPAWARQDPLPTAPPDDPQTYASFLAAAVRHYRGRVRCFQVWDDPNIAPHWGSGYVDPAAYTALLQAAYTAAKDADPDCLILGAGLAPNWETGGKNLNEIDFLRRMYQAGAKGYFDVLGAKPYGFWETPDDPRLDPHVLNFSRLVLLREVMEEFGDRDTPVWAVAFGWNALPADWAGRPATWGTDAEDRQAQRTVAAMRRARTEWPWLGVMTLACFRWAGDPADPIRGFALVEPDFAPRALYTVIAQALHAPPVATPGIHEPAHPAITWGPGWRQDPDETGGTIAVGSVGLTTTLLFVGTRLDAVTRGGALDVSLDGGPPTRVSLEHSGSWQAQPLVRDVQDTLHRVHIRVAADYIAIDAFRVVREKPLPPYEAAIALLLAALAVNLLLVLRYLSPPPTPSPPLPGERRGLGGGVGFVAMLLALAWYQWCPGDVTALLGLAALALLAMQRPALYLVLVALTAPFYLSLWRFASVTETLVLVGVVGWALRALWLRDGWAMWPRRTDGPVLFFLAVGLLSLLAAERQGVALRELRTVVVEPVLLFALVTRAVATPQEARRIADGLILAGVCAALWGIGQFALGQDIITAEGVWRARAAYPSPNNLGLFLERTLPVAMALALGSPRWRDRGLYALAVVVTGIGLALTFSRGAWLGAGVALLFLGLLGGRRMFVAVVALWAVGLLALVPLGRVERFASLFDLQEGTTFLRLKLWQAALRMALDHPLQGVGLDNFLYKYPDYRLPEAWAEPNLSHPHNLILDWWLRLGVLGLVALAALLLDFFRRAIRVLGAADAGARVLAAGLAASMVAALVHGLIDNSYFLVDLATVFMLSYGLVVALDQSPRPKAQTPRPKAQGPSPKPQAPRPKAQSLENSPVGRAVSLPYTRFYYKKGTDMASFWRAIPNKVKWLAPAFFLLVMGEAMSAGFLALYVQHLGAMVEQVGLFFTVNMVAVAAAWVLGGWVSDSLGRLPTAGLGLLLGTVGYAGSALMPVWPLLWLSVAVSTFGLAAASLSYLAYATAHTPEAMRGRITSLFGAGGGLAALIGVPLAGQLSEHLGFRGLYGVIAGLAATGLVLALPQLRGERWTPGRLHLAGLRESVGGVWRLLTLGGIVTWVFLLDGARDLGFSVSEQFIPVYYRQIGGLSLAEVGLLGGVATVGAIVLTPLGGWLADRLSERVGIAVAAVLGLVGMVLFVSAQGLGGFALAMVVFASARSFMDPAFLAMLTKSVSVDRLGLVLGLTGTALSVLSTPGPALGGILWNAVAPAAPFLGTGLILLLVAVPVWFTFRPGKQDAPGERET